MARIDWRQLDDIADALRNAAPGSPEAELARERLRAELDRAKGRVVEAREDAAEMWAKLRRRSFFRGAQWAAVTILCMWATLEWVSDPRWQAMLWTAGKASMGALLGYWVGRTFLHGRPHEAASAVFRIEMERNRSIIIAGAMVAAAFA